MAGYAGLATGAFAPVPAGELTPFISHALILILFLSFLDIDFRTLIRLRGRDLAQVAGWTLAKLVLLPLALWAVCRLLIPGWALAVLLLAGTSAGVMVPFFAGLLGAEIHRSLQVVVATSLLLPLTLPGLTKLLLGQELPIPFSHMARMLGMIIFIPLLLTLLGRRTAPALLAWLGRRRYPLMLVLVFICNAGVFAPFAGFLRSQADQALLALTVSILVALAAAAGGLAWGLLFGDRMSGLGGAIAFTFSNSMLVVVFAAKFFGPRATLLPALYTLPFFLMILPLRWLKTRLGLERPAGDGV